MSRRHVLAGALALFVTLAVGIDAGGATSFNSPPGGVYTCAWIAANPTAAAQARVSCDATAPPIVAGTLPAASIAPLTTVSPFDTETCMTVPSSGTIGKGVFAWTPSYYYSYQWVGANNGYSGPNYTWYVEKEDGTVMYSATETDWLDHNSSVLGSNYYDAGFQNHSSTASAFSACYISH